MASIVRRPLTARLAYAHTTSPLCSFHRANPRRAFHFLQPKTGSRSTIAVQTSENARHPQHRSLSTLGRLVSNISSNRPFQLYVAASAAIIGGMFYYKNFVQENVSEQTVMNETCAAIAGSMLPTMLHHIERSRVIVNKGNKLSGHATHNVADLWFDVTVVSKGDEPVSGKAMTVREDQALGTYKVHVRARRDSKPLATNVSIAKSDTASVTGSSGGSGGEPAPWVIDTLTMSSLLKRLSYEYDPATQTFQRADDFIPVTSAPSKPISGTSTDESSSFFNAQRIAFGLAGILVTSVGALAFYRWQYKQRVIKHLQSLVDDAIKRSSIKAFDSAHRNTLLESKIKPGLATAQFAINSTAPATAASGAAGANAHARVVVQAVRDLKAGESIGAQWKLVHASLTTRDGRSQQLKLQ